MEPEEEVAEEEQLQIQQGMGCSSALKKRTEHSCAPAAELFILSCQSPKDKVALYIQLPGRNAWARLVPQTIPWHDQNCARAHVYWMQSQQSHIKT